MLLAFMKCSQRILLWTIRWADNTVSWKAWNACSNSWRL